MKHAFSVVTDDGWLRSIVGSVTDITTIKWAEGIQKRKMEDAIEAKRQQENFIDVTSHEMRNPLSAIMISVDDILTISKLDSGLFSINPIEVQPVALIQDLSKMFAGEYNAAGITQMTIVEDSYKALAVDWVLLDSSRLTQILINLITNSIKFTQYQPAREIQIRQLQNIEQTFEQPLMPRKDQLAPITTTNTTNSTNSVPPSVPSAPRPPFDCLIVEDNKVNQQVMSKGLVKLGHTVFVANHGAEALDFLRTTRHWRGNASDAQNLSVVLMDIEMPVMDGLTCVREIRRLEREGDIADRIRVIAITANARVEQVNTAKHAGMDDVVSKPFRVAELIASIERLVDAKEPRVEAVEVKEAD
ncbi:putative histidine kinase hhk13p [Diplodia seriata]|uniref:Putative histidine kinase hhk13p n=1 Tax=Diplodia seriata TaxID=420778 RepID=A0A0G2E8N9_9PEZI|nr:putative histidine kinase hhk13p [Diplodia seriata]